MDKSLELQSAQTPGSKSSKPETGKLELNCYPQENLTVGVLKAPYRCLLSSYCVHLVLNARWSSVSKGEVIKVNLEPQCLPFCLRLDSFCECEIGGNCPFFTQVGPCAGPHFPSPCPWYRGCTGAPFPLDEKTGGPYCHH